jgi:hypothetical protein
MRSKPYRSTGPWCGQGAIHLLAFARLATIVAESELVQVAVKVVFANAMMDAANPPLTVHLLPCRRGRAVARTLTLPSSGGGFVQNYRMLADFLCRLNPAQERVSCVSYNPIQAN